MHLSSAAMTLLSILVIVLVGLVAFLILRRAVRLFSARFLATPQADDPSLAISGPERVKRVETIARLIIRTAAVVIGLVVVLMALSQLGIDIGPAIAGVGVAGVAISLGTQTFVRDLVAGMFILAENQFSRGDIVRIGGAEGVVEEFGLRRTVLRDIEGTVHHVPNGQITVASNLTRVWSRVNLDVAVARDADLEQALRLLDEIGTTMAADPEWHDRILEPPAVLRVENIGETAVTLKVLGMVRAAEQWSVAGEFRRRTVAAFDEAGIGLRG
jgi:small conductance mechanosensitive channel